MDQRILKYFAWFTVISFAACSSDGFVDLGSYSGAKGGGNFRPPGERPEAFNFEKECGIDPEKADDTNAVLLSGKYASFPIIVEGSKSVPIVGTVNYRVILLADITINATRRGATIDRAVKVFKAEPALANLTAGKKAKDVSGSTKTAMMPIGDWLKLTGPSGNPELKDLLCVVAGAKSSTAITGEGTLDATFSPALVNSISPLAPPERMRKEIGSGRTFNVTANVTSVPKTGGLLEKADSNFKIGSKTGKITIRETQPVLSVVNQDANINKTITADIAYEVINDFPNGAYTVGLPKRAVYLIDTKNKTLKAIMFEDDRPDPETGKPASPPVVIVKEN